MNVKKIVCIILVFLLSFGIFLNINVQAETITVNGEEVNPNDKYIYRNVKNEWNEEKNCYVIGYNIFNKGRVEAWFILFNKRTI